MTERPPDDRQVHGLDRHGADGERDQDAAKHQDEVKKDSHWPLGRQRPVGDVEWLDQILEGTVDCI